MKDLIAALQSLTLPWDAITGARIVLDGVNGRILIYDAADNLVISLSPLAGTDSDGNTVHVGIADIGSLYTVVINNGEIIVTLNSNPTVGLTINPLQFQFSPAAFVSNFLENDTNGIGFRTNATTLGVYLSRATGFLELASVGPYDSESWTDVAFAANWVHWTERTQYKLMPDGTVRLKGSAQYTAGVPAGGTDIFTLPAGYRPPQQRLYVIPHWASATHSRILILPTGVVEIYDAPNEFPAFDIISFSTI